MVSSLTLPDIKRIILAAHVGPQADRDRGLVALAVATGMALWHLVRVEDLDLCGRYGAIKEYFLCKEDGQARLVRLCPGVRRILKAALPPEDDFFREALADGLLLSAWMFCDSKCSRALSVSRARRIVARSFVAAGLPPQRAAERLRDAFFKLGVEWEGASSTRTLPVAFGRVPRTERKATPEKSNSGPRRSGQGVLCV